MSYCQIHGRYDDYFDRGCPNCQNAEQELRQAEWELRNAVSEAAYAKTNPGDYDCPHCKYRSLRADASRCPLCHGEIGREYWNAVWAKEKTLAEIQAASSKALAERKKAMGEAAAAEWIRTLPEREAAAARAAAEAQRLRRNAASKKYSETGAGIGATLGAIVIGLSGCANCLNYGHPGLPGDGKLTIPLFNLVTGLLLGAIIGGMIGAVIGFSIGQNES
jgi:hypothetical protein